MLISTSRKRIKAMLEDVERYHAEKISKADDKERERVQRLYDEYIKEVNK